MKTLYLECNMGAAGDMLMAALLELLDASEQAAFLKTMNNLIPDVAVECEPSEKCGLRGSHIRVHIHGEEEHSHDHPHGHSHGEHEHPHVHPHGEHEHSSHMHAHSHEHEHEHRGLPEICGLIDHFPLPAPVLENAKAVYRLIAEAEAHAHGVPAGEVHFHEVGSLDAVADVTGCCLLLHLLGADRICASPVSVGSGFVRCAHGVLPVPAPATAHLLLGIPSCSGAVAGELCTPTGAALLRHFAESFGKMPEMSVFKVGCGMGTKDFEIANCLRAFLGASSGGQDEIEELSCNLDDMTPEALGYACERLLEAGALDVFTTPVYMKKGRPAYLLTCLCKPDDSARIAEQMLLQTTTLGVRMHACRRRILTPSVRIAETVHGPIRIKTGDGFGIHKEKPEYEDVRAAAEKSGLPFGAVWQDVSSRH